LFRSIDRLDQVTKADIRRVANTMFQSTNRVVGMIETVSPAGGPQPGTSGEGQS
nr:insulinase family protein [Nitrospirales bacterium]